MAEDSSKGHLVTANIMVEEDYVYVTMICVLVIHLLCSKPDRNLFATLILRGDTG